MIVTLLTALAGGFGAAARFVALDATLTRRLSASLGPTA